MKINKTNNKAKKTLFFILIVVLLVFSGVFLWINLQSSNTTTQNQNKDSAAQKTTEATNSEQKTTSDQTETKVSSSNTDHAEGTIEESTGETTFAVYTTVRTEDNTVSISAQISGLLYDDGTGTCTHTLTHNDGTEINIAAQILESPGNKYCGKISKNFNELKPGSWKVTTNYNNSNQKYKGKSDVQSFTIE